MILALPYWPMSSPPGPRSKWKSVEEHQVQFAEEIAAWLEERLLDPDLSGSGRSGNRDLGWFLIERFAQEGHGPS